MSHLRDDAWRACADRRARASVTPARVSGPVASGLAAVIIAIAAAHLVGLSPWLVTAIAFGVAFVALLALHRTLGSLLAGAALRLARPYGPGEQVRLFLPEVHSVIDAEVVRVGLANTTLMTGGGLVVVANSLMLRAAPEQTAGE